MKPSSITIIILTDFNLGHSFAHIRNILLESQRFVYAQRKYIHTHTFFNYLHIYLPNIQINYHTNYRLLQCLSHNKCNHKCGKNYFLFFFINLQFFLFAALLNNYKLLDSI